MVQKGTELPILIQFIDFDNSFVNPFACGSKSYLGGFSISY